MKLRLPAACALALVCACHKGPAITSFTADRTDVQAGDVVTLTVAVENASSLVLDPGGNSLRPVSHSFQIVAKETVELVLTASRPAVFVGHLSAQARLQLHVAPRLPVVTLSASPAQVLPGGSATLSWDATPATSVTIFGGTASLGDHPAKGTLAVTPSATTTYSLQAHLPADPQPQPAVAAVRVVPLPTVHLSADKNITTSGDAVTLSWSGSGANGYSLDNGVGYLGLANSSVVRPAQTTTYKVTAFGPALGTASDSVTIIISGPAPGTRTLSYTDPLPLGARLALRKDAASTPALLILNVVTTQAVQAGGLALDLPFDASRAQLDGARAGDASPGFTVSPNGLDPGPLPLAARAVLGSGPLAGMLVLAIAQKAQSPGVVPDATIAPGSVLCTLRVVPVPAAQPGQVFAGAGAKAWLGHLPRDPSSQPEPIAVGTLTVN